jgi:ABC-2 type transport system permease protein
MNASTYLLSDTATMLRRSLRRMRRYPTVLYQAGIPVFFLLLFVYVLGGTLGAGLGGASGGRDEYVRYIFPGIIVMTVAGSATGIALMVAMDMKEGIVARFRTMAIARSSVLTAHVVASVLQAILAVAIVAVVAVVIGFRPATGAGAWLAAVGLVVLAAFAITWLGVALGLVSGSPESASNLPLPLIILPFFGSGFVPTGSMPDVLRWFAENQPFTPIIETLRGLLLGTPIGDRGLVAIGWCVAITLVSFVWAVRLYEREPTS